MLKYSKHVNVCFMLFCNKTQEENGDQAENEQSEQKTQNGGIEEENVIEDINIEETQSVINAEEAIVEDPRQVVLVYLEHIPSILHTIRSKYHTKLVESRTLWKHMI